MKRNLPFYKIAIIGAMFCLPFNLKAQEDVASFLNAGIQDAKTLSDAYLEPFGTAFSTALTGGWYNTGAPHKLLGFDLTLSVNYVMYPNDAKSFDLKDLNLKALNFDPNLLTKTPTIAGSQKDPVPSVGIKGVVDGNEFAIGNLFQMAPGAYPDNMPVAAGVPLPMLNAGIGLIKGTEIMGRYVPKISAISDIGEFSLWGVGVKHDFKQWIPVVKLLPFDASIMAAYTKINFKYDNINFHPSYTGLVDSIFILHGNSRIDELKKSQSLELSTSAFTSNLIISKKLLMFTVYGSVGFYSSNFDVSLKGDYAVPRPYFDQTELQVKTVVNEKDVYNDIEIVNSKNTSFRAGLGLRVKLLLVTIHADYTYQDYSMITAGLGISFR